MTTEVCDLPFNDGLGNINTFIEEYEEHVPQCQRLLAMDITLRATLARWWGTHKKNIGTWQECRRLIWIRFVHVGTQLVDKYDGQTDPREHIQLCMTTWKEFPREEWVHGFIHTLETIPQKWYLETKIQHGTRSWVEMVDGFILKFRFEDGFPCID